METYIIKLGGSVIAEKGSEDFPTNLEEIKARRTEFYKGGIVSRLVDELYDAQQEREFRVLGIFNGAGDFGHGLVGRDFWERHRSAELVHESVKYLNSLVMNSFAERGYILKPVHPYSTVYYLGIDETTGLEKFDFGVWWDSIKNVGPEEIPSSYGDIVPVAEGVKGRFDGFDLVSADDFYLEFGSRVLPSKAIFVIDVDGLCTADPKKSPDAKLVAQITSKEYIDAFFPEASLDPTGGMYKKIKKSQALAGLALTEFGVTTQVINGKIKGRLYDALCGNKTVGTFVLP